MYYRLLKQGLADFGQLIPETDDVFSYVKNRDKDHYLSVFKYNETQRKLFDETGTIAGIEDVVTDRLWWDFDLEDNLELAKSSTIALVGKLQFHNINPENIHITFSGKKGFGIGINLDTILLTPQQVKLICFSLAQDLPGFDGKIYNACRTWRLTGTRHPDSNLYKIPIDFHVLKEASISEILAIANNPVGSLCPIENITLPASLLGIALRKPEPVKQMMNEPIIDFERKIKGWPNCKWALSLGVGMVAGDRHEKYLCLAATAKSLYYTQAQAFHHIVNADKLGAKLYQCPRGEKEEIGRQVESVYSDKWRGGTYSCKDGKTPWLSTLCQSLGPHQCKAEEKTFCELSELSSSFFRFTNEIDKNRIPTGIKSLDEKVTLCTSTLVGLLGNPGSGKTSFAMNVLQSCSKTEIPSIFFSMDMGVPLVYLKMIQKLKKMPHEEVFERYKNDRAWAEQVDREILDNYGNVKFCFKTGLNVDEMKLAVSEYQEKTGKKIRLVVVDYLECISGPYSDSTANTAIIANKLKDLANETETCVLLLLQTQKHAAAPDEPLLSMKNIKGSSVLEQASSVVLSIWREGYHPHYSDRDRFISIATVKDRFNGLWQSDFRWEGISGKIGELDAIDEIDVLRKLRQEKKAAKESQYQEVFR